MTTARRTTDGREGLLPHNPAGYRVAVVGATGAVGRAMLEILHNRRFPVRELIPLASSRSAGSIVEFGREELLVGDLADFDPAGCDLALFSAGGDTSREHAPRFAEAGCFVIDNSSAWRMDPEVALVVPEVNPHALETARRNRIIANPNCSTIQMVVALAPLHRAAEIRRIVVATYQAVSGAGNRAIEELASQTRNLLCGTEAEVEVLPARIAFNVIPQIDRFLDDGYTKEEHKMMEETRKILECDTIGVSATTVRVPVFYGHSEAVNVEFARSMDADRARDLLAEADGVCVVDDPAGEDYPMASEAGGTDPVWVGRIRNDASRPNTIDMWIVADNIRKGAALNAVQIAELLVEGG
ncbi:MAG: aspartate-semialdehyde dehydrogenase [Zetaproteobacteria bacterium]|nr:MAG: aspartate-semialdehyde dehydrogenase [Zetaproteobacteria bacterium]